MAVSQITPLPPAPQRSDAPADFVAKADAHVASLDQFVTETNQVAVEMNAATTAASASAAQADSAAQAALSASNFKGRWADLTGALNVPASVFHAGNYWQLLQNLTDVTLDEPGQTANWAVASLTPSTFPQTGGGFLIQQTVNELQDAGAYILPDASDLDENEFIDVLQPDLYSDNQPTATTTGGQLITYKGGTDTSFIFNRGSLTEIRFISNGVNGWRI